MIDLDGEHWAACLAVSLDAQMFRLDGSEATLTVVPKGPWKIGFVDFVAGSRSDPDLLVASAQSTARAVGVDVLRFVAERPVTGSRRFARYPQEACRIPDLQGWQVAATDKGRRTRNRRARSGLVLRVARLTDAACMHALYVATVVRQGGVARYGLAYFEALAPHAGTVAMLDDEVVGFVCTGHKAGRGLYLHGAQAPLARRHHPSDLLFLTMLEAARNRGLQSFDFLASPQPGLLQYKQAWGGERFTEWTSDLEQGPMGGMFVMAYAAHQRWRRYVRAGQEAGTWATNRTSA